MPKLNGSSVVQFDSKHFNGEVFGRRVDRVPSLKKMEMMKRGVIKSDARVDKALNSNEGTFTHTASFYAPLSVTAQTYDGETNLDKGKGVESFKFSLAGYGKMFAVTEKDFSADITGDDPMEYVAGEIGKKWEEINYQVLLDVLEGIFSMKSRSGEEKEFIDKHITKLDGKLNATTLNSAITKACGDRRNTLNLVFMHSSVACELENQNVLEFMKYTKDGAIQVSSQLATWNGRLVIVDDTLPFDSSTGEYTTYVLGNGSFIGGDLKLKHAYGMARDEFTNGGQDTLVCRERRYLHPYGFDFQIQNLEKYSAENTDYKAEKNWKLASTPSGVQYPAKAIPIVKIVSKLEDAPATASSTTSGTGH